MTAQARALTLGIIGAGRAASALMPRWIAAGHVVIWQQLRDDPVDIAARPEVDVVIIAVGDGDIAGVVARLGERPSGSQEVWLHLSGSLPGALARFDASRPAAAGCLHPLVALAGASGLGPLNAVAGLDGDANAIVLAIILAEGVGLTPRVIDSAHKALYHAAAVTVAGHATALFAQGMRLMQGAGMTADDARLALAPLMRSAAVNLISDGPATAITGPIARGDIQTVAAHLRAIDDLGDRASAGVYRALGLEALALSHPTLPADVAASLQALLDGAESP